MGLVLFINFDAKPKTHIYEKNIYSYRIIIYYHL